MVKTITKIIKGLFNKSDDKSIVIEKLRQLTEHHKILDTKEHRLYWSDITQLVLIYSKTEFKSKYADELSLEELTRIYNQLANHYG